MSAGSKHREEKDEIIENFNTVKDSLFDVRQLKMEQLQLQEESNIITKMIQKCINESVYITTTSDKAGCQKRCDELEKRLDSVQVRLSEVGQTITKRQIHREKIGVFLKKLQKQKDIITEFDEDLWYSLVEYVTVFDRENVCFRFKNGAEIK